MKLIGKHFDKDGQGQVTLIPEDSEDMWHAYNLVANGDSLRSTTVRKVCTESATGSTSSNRVRTTLTISVEGVDFDGQACLLRVRGRNIQENQHVKMGAYHTLDLELNRKFTLAKQVWDVVAIERVELACDPSQSADVAAIVMQEGLANVCLVTPSMTIVRAKIETVIPRKRRGNCSQHDKSLTKFYESVLQALLRHLNFDVLKCVIIASPGFVKDQFYEYMYQEAVKSDNKLLFENKPKFMLAHCSSGYKHSLKELFTDVNLQARLADTRATAEIRALDDFYKMLHDDSDRAAYGEEAVNKAVDNQAVEVLLLTDNLFRCQDVNKRKSYVRLVEEVREVGGEVRIFSSLHVSGEQLAMLSGIAATLRFPMPELDLQEDDDSSDGG